MKNIAMMLCSIAMLASGCGDDILEIIDPIGPFSYTPSNQAEVSDVCDFFNPGQPGGTFELFIDGMDATLTHTFMDNGTEITRVASSSTYDPTANGGTFVHTRSNAEFTPCEVDLADTYVVSSVDDTIPLEDNAAVTVRFSHVETETSTDACNDNGNGGTVWFVMLPCTSEVTFTLTKDPVL